jgi:hypothetical protein
MVLTTSNINEAQLTHSIKDACCSNQKLEWVAVITSQQQPAMDMATVYHKLIVQIQSEANLHRVNCYLHIATWQAAKELGWGAYGEWMDLAEYKPRRKANVAGSYQAFIEV